MIDFFPSRRKWSNETQVIDKFKPVDILIKTPGVREDGLLVRMKKKERENGFSLKFLEVEAVSLFFILRQRMQHYESANQDK